MRRIGARLGRNAEGGGRPIRASGQFGQSGSIDTTPENPWRVRIGKEPDFANMDRNRRAGGDRAQRSDQGVELFLRPLANKFGRDVEIRRRTPIYASGRAQALQESIQILDDSGRQVEAGKETHFVPESHTLRHLRTESKVGS